MDPCAGAGTAMPPMSPLEMPRHAVHERRRRRRRRRWRARPAATAAGRLALAAVTLALAGFGIREMHGVLASGGITVLQWAFLAIFALNFLWISFAACQAVIGFVRQLLLDLMPRGRRRADAPPLTTALLAPVYNEDPRTVGAALVVMAEGLAAKAPGQFAVFILSDTNQPERWIAEEAVFRNLIELADPGCPIHYRHRRDNAERKAGNIADWVMRWGGSWDAMLILDADSLIEPDTIREMARRLGEDPGLGLIQSLPSIAGARSLFARLQQFATRCYGPIFANGLAAWYGRSGNYWGHNAIIRTRAFAEAARLPVLGGSPPFGGHILSHDFIEAAFLRRAGWGVRFDTDLADSFERAPPSLTDLLVRDRRWCQGNLQHIRLIFARGLALPTRLHLLTGVMAYLSAVFWALLVVTGLLIAVQAALTRPEYFKAPALFPAWPIFDSERAIMLFAVSMTVVLLPKLLGWLAVMVRPHRLRGFGGPVALTVSVAFELFFSILYAPVMMVAQSRFVFDILRGHDTGWAPQRRDDGTIDFATAAHNHRGHVLVGLILSGISLGISPDLFLWLLPVTGGLVMSACTSWMSGSFSLGGGLSRLAVLRTPEEKRRTRAPILVRFEDQLARMPEPGEGMILALAHDRELRDWHFGQIMPEPGLDRPFDADLVVARAKAAREHDAARLDAWLTAREATALLHDHAFLADAAAHWDSNAGGVRVSAALPVPAFE